MVCCACTAVGLGGSDGHRTLVPAFFLLIRTRTTGELRLQRPQIASKTPPVSDPGTVGPGLSSLATRVQNADSGPTRTWWSRPQALTQIHHCLASPSVSYVYQASPLLAGSRVPLAQFPNWGNAPLAPRQGEKSFPTRPAPRHAWYEQSSSTRSLRSSGTRRHTSPRCAPHTPRQQWAGRAGPSRA